MKIFSPIAFLLIVWLTQAQDIHFSQFYASPLTLNPASTGFYNADFRIGGNFKSQWPWAIHSNLFTYRTFSAYADVAFLKEKLPGNWFGAGLVVVNDKAGDGELSATKLLASVAYHQPLGAAKKYFLSFGVNGGYVQKGVDYDRLYFNSQWDDFVFDRDIPNNEPGDGNDIRYFDLSAGVSFSYYHNEYISLSVGGAAFHLNRPEETFYASGNRLGIRPVASVSAYLKLGKKFQLEPAVLYMNQKAAHQTVISLLAGYIVISEDLLRRGIFYFGSSVRINDAYIPVIGFEYYGVRLLMNYDLNLSSLTEASGTRGGLEISLVYSGVKATSLNKLAIPCPRL